MERTVEVLGLRLAAYDSGDGPPLLLLHGMGSSYNSWMLSFPVLEPRYRCIAPDLPGFGSSDLPSHYFTVGDFAHALWAMVDALRIDACRIIGHSFGALVATEMAASRPSRVERLMLVAPPGACRESADLALGHLIRWVREDGLPRLLTVEEARQFSPAADATWLELANYNLRRARGFIRALPAGATYAVAERARHIACPTLLVWGSNDLVVPPQESAMWSSWIPNARILLVDGASHSPQFETPQRFNEETVAFLSQ